MLIRQRRMHSCYFCVVNTVLLRGAHTNAVRLSDEEWRKRSPTMAFPFAALKCAMALNALSAFARERVCFDKQENCNMCEELGKPYIHKHIGRK